MGRLDGKVALVSGGARGMGAAEAQMFADEGAKVVIGDVLDDEGKQLAAGIGDAARYTHLDVTKEDDWAAAVATATSEFGKLDVLVNNAGIVRMGAWATTSLEDYMAVITVNQVGVFLGVRAAIPAMTDAGGGSIVNISSIDGLIGHPMVAGYVSSKFAVRGLTKVAALELAPMNIRVNSVHPGFIDTPMLRVPGMETFDFANLVKRVPANRLGTPDDITRLALFLASDESDYCTGSEFVADGGVTCGFGFFD